ncbi:hypothetical protein AQUCO_03300118v1 [Aquilegia coerulea]|uniref:PGG domain-containing protein n=1 Tax=Aquilegia coerulea TaxID=218851 RepID=A0A2G5D0H0_AQUCA|nr:hypothetical protein AQUCO_03300118v1 [Aquilegia coerulea]
MVYLETACHSNHKPSDEDYTWAVPFINAMHTGDWESFKGLLDLHPGSQTRFIDGNHLTFLHFAIVTGIDDFAKKLVELMSPGELQLTDRLRNTALVYVAESGTVETAEAILVKNSELLCIRDVFGLLPVVKASIHGNKDVVRYLYEKTPKDELNGQNGASFVSHLMLLDMYDLVLDLLQFYPALAIVVDDVGRNPLTTLATRPSAFPSGHRLGFWERTIVACFGIKLHDMKATHAEVFEVLKIISTQVSLLSRENLVRAKAYTAVTNASQFGIVEFVGELMKCNPYLQFGSDENLRGIFGLSIMHRQEKVFNLVHAMKNSRTSIDNSRDRFNNNLLHQAAFLMPYSQTYRISGVALQMQRELQWFKEVEKIVPHKYSKELNLNNETPQALFTKNHKDMLKEGEIWMKETSQACMVVATLIATVVFAAAFTVPGGNNSDTGAPVFIRSELFMVFIITDTISLFSSCSSMLMFLAILTSRYAEEDFLHSLPRKLILGLTTLFFSIATMMAAFCASLFIVLHERSAWLPILCTLLACVPVSLFAMLQFPLLVDMVYSTYGPSTFYKKNKGSQYH